MTCKECIYYYKEENEQKPRCHFKDDEFSNSSDLAPCEIDEYKQWLNEEQ